MSRKKQIAREKRIEKEKEIAQAKIKNSKFKQKLLTAGAILTGLTLAYVGIEKYKSNNLETTKIVYSEVKTSPELENARKNANLRQSYLESLVSSNDIPFSSGVIYDADGKKMLEYMRNLISRVETNQTEINIALDQVRKSMQDQKTPVKTPEVFNLSGEDIKSPIYVNKIMFEDKQLVWLTSKELKHILIHHEGRHAEQFSKGLNKLGYISKEKILQGVETQQLRYNALYDLGEIDALNSEILAVISGKSQISSKLYEKTLYEYRDLRNKFEQYSSVGSSIQKELISKILKNNPAR